MFIVLGFTIISRNGDLLWSSHYIENTIDKICRILNEYPNNISITLNSIIKHNFIPFNTKTQIVKKYMKMKTYIKTHSTKYLEQDDFINMFTYNQYINYLNMLGLNENIDKFNI